MDPTAVPPPPDPGLPDEPVPLPPARGHGIVAERLISLNGLISLLLLCWGALALRRPDLVRRAGLGLWRWLPWLVGREPPA
jgi:hypothetical protein